MQTGLFIDLCLFKWCSAPTIGWRFSNAMKFESSPLNVSRLFVFGSCHFITKECSSTSFNTEPQRMYPVQVLRGAACCCTIHQRLLPLLYAMQFCFEEVWGEKKLCYLLLSLCSLCIMLFSEQKTQLWNPESRISTKPACSSSLVSFSLESDLWDYTDIGSGIWGGLSAGSAGPEDQTAPEPPSGAWVRSHRDQVQPTCTQTARQCAEVSGKTEKHTIIMTAYICSMNILLNTVYKGSKDYIITTIKTS